MVQSTDLKSKWKSYTTLQNSDTIRLGAVSVTATSIAIAIFLYISSENARFQASEMHASEAIQQILTIHPDERFLWYTPHSGFGNQLMALRNALRMAGILNRTLIIPPVLGHNSGVMLGDCASKKVVPLHVMRKRYWSILTKVIYSSNYTSMADIIDISAISPDLVRTIDMRIFLAIHCGLNLNESMSGCSWCHLLLGQIENHQRSLWRENMTIGHMHDVCAAFVGNKRYRNKGPRPVYPVSVHTVWQDCASSIFMYARSQNLTLLNSFEPQKNQHPAVCPGGLPFTFSNRRIMLRTLADRAKQKVAPPKPLNIVEKFGSLKSRLINFGSSFFFFDFSVPMGDNKADAISCATEFLSFVSPIMKYAQNFANDHIKKPFTCLHFRGGDMRFKKKVKQTLKKAEEDLKTLKETVKRKDGRQENLFLMSDLTSAEWKGKFQDAFEPAGFSIHYPDLMTKHFNRIKREIQRSGRSLITNRLDTREALRLSKFVSRKWDSYNVGSDFFNSIGVVLEQAVCSCADVGFIGNELSTVSENVRRMIKGKDCSRSYE